MTGIEPLGITISAVSAFGQRLLGRGIRSFTLRMRVAWRIKRSVAWNFPATTFRVWLNLIEIEDLNQPLEIGGPRLARDLDRALGTNTSWATDGARHSKALLLVEELYAVVPQLVESSAADALRDSWAGARHAELLNAFANLASPTLHFSRQDLSIWLRGHSTARRSVRLGAMGIGAEQLEESFAQLSSAIPEVGAGSAVVLIGPFGSGKSEAAEEWHLRAIRAFEQDESAPRPVWFHASELGSRSLQAALESLLSAEFLETRGAAVVIDGLDEIDAQTAARIVDQARAAVAVSQNTAVLLTCRPGVLDPHEGDLMYDGLDDEHARVLVERVSGSERASWNWDPLLVDAVRRPFFAIAAGLMLVDRRRPAGQAHLIRFLVERALGRNSSASPAIRSKELSDTLTLMAVGGTASGNRTDGLSFQQRQAVRESTLVRIREDGTAEFSLPIFQQWFAAQELLRDSRRVETAISSSEQFDRWRWALAIAGVSADARGLDDLLDLCVRANPGAGSWLLARISDGHDWFRDPDGESIDADSAPARLLRATRCWIDSLGPLGSLVVPVRADGPIGLGVDVKDNRVTTGWLRVVGEKDEVRKLPDHVHPLGKRDEEWVSDRSGSIAEGEEWPWVLSASRHRGSLLQLLETHTLLGPKRGVWHVESMYLAARLIARGRTVFFDPISAGEVRSACQRFLEQVDDPRWSTYSISGGSIPGPIIADLASWIDESGVEWIERPVPKPDVDRDNLKGSWVWDFYTERGLTNFYAETLGLAAVAYEELAAKFFPRFSWSLATGAEGPFGVIADVSYHPDGWGGSRTPGITYSTVPLGLMDAARMASTGLQFQSSNGRAFVTLSPDRAKMSSWVAEFVRSESLGRAGHAFSTSGSYTDSVADATGSVRPASQFAARWMFDDLKELGVAEGTFPQLER